MINWTRVNKAEIKSQYYNLEKLIDDDWLIDVDNDRITVATNTDSKKFPVAEIDISSFAKIAGQSQKIMLRDKSSQVVLKKYLKEVYSRSEKKPSVYIDFLESDEISCVLRQKIVDTQTEDSFADIFEEFKTKLKYKEVVIGSDGGHNAEVQLLFGEDIVVKKSPQKGDIVNKGLFFNLNGGVNVSYGINRLICTNGAVSRSSVFKRSMSEQILSEVVAEAEILSTWFCGLPDKKVESIRTLSILLKDMPSRVQKEYWKSWSEKFELDNLTYFEVVNDITEYAKRSLGYSRHVCMNIPNVFKKIEKHECPVCSAGV